MEAPFGKIGLWQMEPTIVRKPGLFATGISPHAKIRKFVDPTEKHLVARDLLKERARIHMGVEER